MEKKWSDAETRFILEIWRDNFPISKRRNSGAWDSIAKQLNKVLTEQGTNTYRNGAQCKARMKHLVYEYKKDKDHNGRSGHNRETYEYYEELDSVLGYKPNISPRCVVDCGLAESGDESPLDLSKNDKNLTSSNGANDYDDDDQEDNDDE
ncbi:hypothetical protein QZH41_002939 [Actinostola sp. cb2023]|nr:hypothetical protein QZH41_002939 [Actinostola sp. cb2023]